MIFEIRNLNCAYSKNGTVLSVPYLNIDEGQIVVVLGKSGYGKSTFLETLALMNNTLKEGSILFNPPSQKSLGPIDIGSLWKNSDNDELAQIRSKHFSFIFQQTNLMPNFSVYENIFIPKLVQGFPENECKKVTLEILDRIGLSGIEAERKVTELSGGQRQRIAFARAVISSFDVLFGDEPTGNLDEANSREIMGLLADFIYKPGKNPPRTAFIVSHSIELALDYADTIVLITWDENMNNGVIDEKSVFKKSAQEGTTCWVNGTKVHQGVDFRNYLRTIF